MTARQKQQIETLESKVGKTHSDWRRANNPNDPVKTMSAEEQRLFDLLQQGLGKILTPAQQRRLWQINLQVMAPQCFTFLQVQKRLQLTTAEEQAISNILHQEQQDMAQVFRTTARRPVEGAQQKLQAMRQRTENQVLQVLTEPQRQAWRELIGKPFGKPQRLGSGF